MININLLAIILFRILVHYKKVQALAVGAIASPDGGDPTLVVDLLMNYEDPCNAPLNVVRWQSDQADVQSLVPNAESPKHAHALLLRDLLQRTGAVPLPSQQSARGFTTGTFEDLATYERLVLGILI